MEVNQLPWIGMKKWQEPVGWERTQQVTLRHADQMSQMSRPTQVSCWRWSIVFTALLCVWGSPARWQARVELGEMYPGTKHFQPIESKVSLWTPWAKLLIRVWLNDTTFVPNGEKWLQGTRGSHWPSGIRPVRWEECWSTGLSWSC